MHVGIWRWKKADVKGVREFIVACSGRGGKVRSSDVQEEEWWMWRKRESGSG